MRTGGNAESRLHADDNKPARPSDKVQPSDSLLPVHLDLHKRQTPESSRAAKRRRPRRIVRPHIHVAEGLALVQRRLRVAADTIKPRHASIARPPIMTKCIMLIPNI